MYISANLQGETFDVLQGHPSRSYPHAYRKSLRSACGGGGVVCVWLCLCSSEHQTDDEQWILIYILVNIRYNLPFILHLPISFLTHVCTKHTCISECMCEFWKHAHVRMCLRLYHEYMRFIARKWKNNTHRQYSPKHTIPRLVNREHLGTRQDQYSTNSYW